MLLKEWLIENYMKEELADYPDILLMPCSSENGSGIEEIRRQIEDSVAVFREENDEA